MDALKCQNMDTMHDVKEMYDGFIFGKHKDIYNPWSILNFIDTKKSGRFGQIPVQTVLLIS